MQHTKLARGAAFALVAAIAFTAAALPAAAATPVYTVSAAYRASTYYQNVCAVPLTGDGAFDAVSVALTQVSYHEGSSAADFGGANQTSAGNFTEYNYALGTVGGTYGYAWCAAFVSWCLAQAGEAESAGGQFASCTLWVEKLQSMGRYRTRVSSYLPRSGDLIFFRSAGTARASDHVGLVRCVKDGRVLTVEGNSSGQVALRDYDPNETSIVGSGLPDYRGAAAPDRAAAEDTAAGWYLVTHEYLNVRAARSTLSAKRGVLYRGDLVRVTDVQNGWGRIVHEGKTAYISLRYADFVAPTTHRIRYVNEGQTVLEKEIFSTDAPTVTTYVPERDGYVFARWESAAGDAYAEREPLPAADLVLTAVWDEVPPAAEPTGESALESAPTEAEAETPASDGEELPAASHSGEALAAEGGLSAVDTIAHSGEELAAQRAADRQPTLSAERHAGVVSALLAVALGVTWLWRRRLNA